VLARAASLIENQTEAGRELISALFAYTGRALTVGITGPPGAGKSTLINALCRALRRQQKSVGIVAIDPSSSYSRGAILGDRIRMREHYLDSGVFIRSMATRGQLGGVATGTLELALLFDAAGLNVVFIETVGVGQDEVEVAQLADVTVVVLVPGFGDDVQAVKAGIMEIADVFAINKADLTGADRLERELLAMQSFAPSDEEGFAPPITRVVATEEQGIDELWSAILSIAERTKRTRSAIQSWKVRLHSMLRDSLLSRLQDEQLSAHATLVASRTEDPYTALKELRAALLTDEKR